MRRWFVVLVDTDAQAESRASAHEISALVIDKAPFARIVDRLRDAERRHAGAATVELAVAEAIARVVQRRA